MLCEALMQTNQMPADLWPFPPLRTPFTNEQRSSGMLCDLSSNTVHRVVPCVIVQSGGMFNHTCVFVGASASDGGRAAEWKTGGGDGSTNGCVSDVARRLWLETVRGCACGEPVMPTPSCAIVMMSGYISVHFNTLCYT